MPPASIAHSQGETEAHPKCGTAPLHDAAHGQVNCCLFWRDSNRSSPHLFPEQQATTHLDPDVPQTAQNSHSQSRTRFSAHSLFPSFPTQPAILSLFLFLAFHVHLITKLQRFPLSISHLAFGTLMPLLSIW